MSPTDHILKAFESGHSVVQIDLASLVAFPYQIAGAPKGPNLDQMLWWADQHQFFTAVDQIRGVLLISTKRCSDCGKLAGQRSEEDFSSQLQVRTYLGRPLCSDCEYALTHSLEAD